MKTDKSQKSRRPMKTSTKVLLTIMGIRVVAIVALGILERCGIMPVDGEIVLYVPLLAVFVLLGWGIYALVGRIDKRGVKVARTSFHHKALKRSDTHRRVVANAVLYGAH